MLKLKQSAQQAATLSLLVSLVFYSFAPAFSMPVFALEQVSSEKPAQQISTSQTDLSQADLLEKPLEAVPEPIIQPIDIGQINPVEINPEEIIPKEDLLPPEDANRDGEEPEPYIQKDEIKSLTDKLNINTDTNTGAFNYTYPIEIPAGRNNLQPDLALSYNNQDTNNQNLFGYGWSLNIPSVERLNKTGIDNLYTDNYFSSSLGGELAPISLSDDVHGTYGPRVENGDFLKYEYTTSSTWIITDKLGTIYTFGKIQADRQDNPSDNTKVYKWMLSEVRDTNDNFIRYQYYKDAGQIYPEKIFYTGHGEIDGVFEIEFVREERADNLGSFQTGFAVVNNYRFSQILVKIDAQWQKKYYLNYETGDNGNRSLLSGIQEAAPSPDQEMEAVMPEDEFGYQDNSATLVNDTLWHIPYNFSSYYAESGDLGVRWADVNGDALVDILVSRRDYGNNNYTNLVYLNNGQDGWDLNENWIIPTTFSSYYSEGRDLGVRLANMDGDDLIDVVMSYQLGNGQRVDSVWLNNGHGWDLDEGFDIPEPFIDHVGRDIGTVLVDVNGDGLTDLMRSRREYGDIGNVNAVYINNGNNLVLDSSWSIPYNFSSYYNENEDSGVRLADVNGDSLVDILVSKRNYGDNNYTNLVYLNNGQDGWDLNENWVIPTTFASYYAQGADMGVRLVDLNNDNFLDIVLSRQNGQGQTEGNVWLNTHQGWVLDEAFYIPQAFVDHVGRDLGSAFADVNGDGLTDLMKSRREYGDVGNVNAVYINNGSNGFLSNINSNQTNINIDYQASAQYTEPSNQVSMSSERDAEVLLPETEFDYPNAFESAWTEIENLDLPDFLKTEAYNGPYFYNDNGVRFGDVNGDGLSDMLRSHIRMTHWAGNIITKVVYINQGNNTWEIDDNYTIPVYFSRVNEIGDGGFVGDGARLSDVNGDGFIDIIEARREVDDTDTKHVYINKGDGTGWEEDLNYVIPFTFIERIAVNGSSFDNDVRLADVNGDGLDDVLVAYRHYEYIHWWNEDFVDTKHVYINKGDGTGWEEDLNYFIPAVFVYTGLAVYGNYAVTATLDAGVRLADVNGDGLTDVIEARRQSDAEQPAVFIQNVYINKGDGTGWEEDVDYVFDGYFVELRDILAGFTQETTDLRFMDINGDQLDDLVQSRYSYYNDQAIHSKSVTINKGDGTGWDGDPDYEIPFYLSIYDPYHEGMSDWFDNGCQFSDVNGDAVVDVICSRPMYGNPHDVHTIYINNNHNKVLENIDNHEGSQINLNYQSSAQSRDVGDELSNPKLPYVIQTVKQINVFDGVATTTIDYQYSGGEQYFDAENPRDKKFAGFAKVEKTIGDKISKTYYQQANETNSDRGESTDTYAKIGKVYRQEVYEAEDLKSASIQKWQEENLSTNRDLVYSPEKSQIDFASSTVMTAAQYDYDLTNGNLLAENNLGQVDLDINTGEILDTLVGDEKTTTYDYATNEVKHILSAPKEKVISDTSDTKSQELYYDDLAFGQVNKVNLTKEDYLVDNVEINREFNDLGLVISETDPENNTVNLLYDENNLYPSEKTNALNQTTYTEYNLLNSQVATSIAENGAMTVNSFDPFGRLIKTEISSPSSTTELLTKQEIVYQDFGFPRFREVKDYFDLNQYKIQREYYDGLDRVIQTKAQMAESESWATQDTAYDAFGRVSRQSLPYISQNIGYSEPDLQQVAKTYTYDALDRVLTENTPVGTTTYEYNGFTTTIYDANDNRKDLVKDAYGNLVQVKEYNGQDIYITNYEYSLTNKLTKITDALGNVRNFVYDDLDNLVSQDMIHRPDVQNIQSITYTYDKNGNVLSQTNLNNQTITYTYDDLNRVLTESVNGAIKTTYTYDQGANNVGKLTYINYNHNGNWQSYNYNLLNQLTDYDVRIHGDNYALNYVYNLNNDFKQIDYPNSKQVNYSFNDIGKVNSVSLNSSLVADNLNYNVNGQLVHLERANGLTTDYSYTPEQAYRLTNLNTSNATSTLQNIDYTYDAVGNILNITDDADTDLARSATYAYDDLNRLSSTTVSYLNIPNSNYSQSFSYDAIGNILTNSALGAYSYTLANPQQLSSVPNQNFTYDNAGNLLTDSQKTLTWDWRSRMIKSQNTGSQNISNYVYDANNQRLMKQTQEPVEIILGAKGGAGILSGGGNPPPAQYITIAEEHYVDQYFERDDKNNDTKAHIFLNGQKIATINNNNAPYYIISDHLNSSSILVDDAGNIAEVSDYRPFGAEAYSNTIIDLDNDYNFTGKETDEESSLQYFGARYMDNNIGRFVSVDPATLILHNQEDFKDKYSRTVGYFLENPQNLNAYSYVLNNPIIHTDPNGEIFDTILDIGFIAYDIGRIASSYIKTGHVEKSEFTALGADTAGAFIPGATGLGLMARTAKVVDKGVDAAKVVKNADKANDAGKYIDNVDDMISPTRQNHILNGNPGTGDKWSGGHKFGTGKGKPEFPSSWSDNQIFHNGLDIATDPSSKWIKQVHGTYLVNGTRNGVNMDVVIDKTGSTVKTIFPRVK